MYILRFFKRQVQVARVAGIPVRIDYRWFIIFGLTVWLVTDMLRRGSIKGLQAGNDLIAGGLGLVTSFALFLSIFGHELAHALLAKMEGIATQEIVLHPFGGLARLARVPDTPRAEFRIAIAGPAASFLLAVVSVLLAFVTVRVQPLIGGAFLLVGIWNLSIAVFNLLPGYPLDGGRVLRAVLWQRSGNLEDATIKAGRGGQMIAWVLVFFGGYMLIVWRETMMAVWSVLIGMYLWDAARSIVHPYVATTVTTVMRPPFLVAPDALLSYVVDHVLPTNPRAAFAVGVATQGQRRLYGILSLADMKEIPREKWGRMTVGEVMRPVAAGLFVEDSMPFRRAHELLQTNGVGMAGVLNGRGELVGVLYAGDAPRQTRRVADSAKVG